MLPQIVRSKFSHKLGELKLNDIVILGGKLEA